MQRNCRSIVVPVPRVAFAGPGEHGFSLVELMVALTLGLLIMAAVVGVFQSTRMTYQTDEALMRLQENARFAMETITRETRQAGALGCSRWVTNAAGGGGDVKPHNNVNVGSAGDPYDFDLSQVFFGFEANNTGPGQTRSYGGSYPANVTNDWNPALNTALVANALPGSDILVVRRMASTPAKLGGPTTGTLVPVTAGAVASFTPGEVAMVYDCARASIFQITGINGNNLEHIAAGTPGNACPDWTQPTAACRWGDQSFSDEDAEIVKVQTTAFYVAQTARGVPALFQASFPGGTEELVEGVENMQMLYGIDDDADAKVDRYVTADAVGASWGNVVAVRLALLVSSVNTTGTSAGGGTDTNSYRLLDSTPAKGVTIDPPNDLRRRSTFEATIVLRSRGV